MNLFIAPDPNRSFFERVVKAVATTFGIDEATVKNEFVLSPETVVIGNKLLPNQSTYNFSPRNNVGASFETDNRLDQNDYFAIQAVGLYFSRCTYASGTNTFSQYGNYPKLTFPDPAYFDGNPASGLDEWQCLQTVVNGKWSFTVGSQQIIPQDVCSKLVYNPQATYTASPLALPEFNGLADPASRGLYNLPMNFILDLNQDNLLNVVLANGDTTVIDGSVTSAGAASTVRNHLWVVMEGIVVKNMGGNRVGSKSC